MAMKYLFTLNASFGHLFPGIRLAHELEAAGHELLFVTAREFEHLVIMQGFHCIPVGNSPMPFFSTVDWYNVQVIADQVRVLDGIVQQYQPDRIVSGPLVMSAFIIAERFNLFHTVIGYAEYLYPALDEGITSPKQWRLDSLTNYYNAARKNLQLPEIAADAENTPLTGDCYLQRSTPDYDNHQPLPRHLQYAGSLYWEAPAQNARVARFAEKNQKVGRPLWYVQIGRLFEDKEKWTLLTRALAEIPAGFVIDTGRADYLNNNNDYAGNILLEPFVPLKELLPRMSGIICSGQATAVLAGIHFASPLLCIPHSDDAKELTRRVISKKSGLGIFSNAEISAAGLKSCMEQLLSGRFNADLAHWQQQFASYEKQLLPAAEPVIINQ